MTENETNIFNATTRSSYDIETPPFESGFKNKELLLLPYVILTMVLLGMAFASFLHFHIQNRGKYSSHKHEMRSTEWEKRKYRVTLNRFAFPVAREGDGRTLAASDEKTNNDGTLRVPSRYAVNHVNTDIEMNRITTVDLHSPPSSTNTPGGAASTTPGDASTGEDNVLQNLHSSNDIQDIAQSKYVHLSYGALNNSQDLSHYEYCDSEKSLISEPDVTGKKVRFSPDINLATDAHGARNVYDNPAFERSRSDSSENSQPAERPRYLDLSAVDLIKRESFDAIKSDGEDETVCVARQPASRRTSSPQLSPVTSDRVNQIPSLHSPEFRRDNRKNQAGLVGNGYILPEEVMYIQI